MAESAANAPESRREIRVFVSSTFRDMQSERDELLKHVFPQIRKLCEGRGVTWGEVDLRWGITDEQVAEGEVLPVCLAEIRNCRPHFIGLLGERYGWVPLSIPAALMASEPWLAEHVGRSVTELEIVHGVLNDPAMAGHATFYFRSPTYVETLPLAEQHAFREGPDPRELAQLGPEEAERRAGERRNKLRALKARIRASGLPVREDYPDPKALGRLVREDLERIISQRFPEGSAPSALDREAAEHEAFARSRVRVYIGGQKYFARLDQHASGEGPPLVVLGDSGVGKSALLANWVAHYRGERPGEIVLQHYIGATAQSANWALMIRRILEEFRRSLAVHLQIPDTGDALRACFANALHLAAVRGRIVLVLDALNQLEDRDQAPDLVWLPPIVPPNVRLVLSTLPGRPLADLERRAWPTMTVEPLDLDERRQVIHDYLALFAKAISPERTARIASAPQAASPLYLRVLLEELRVFGEHERLDDRIGHYLAAASLGDLYQKILERYEHDYDENQTGLVREAFSLISAARRGLSEAELLDLLGNDGLPLPGANWSPLFLAAEAAFVNRSGLLGFFHDFIRQAVRSRYLSTSESQRAAHLRLADYFAAREPGPRQIDELPWQLAEAHSWQRLADLLGDVPFFSRFWRQNQFEVLASWVQVEEHSERRMVETYRFVLAAPHLFEEYVPELATLFDRTGHPQESLALSTFQLDRWRRRGDRARLAYALGNQAQLLAARGDLDGAMALFKESEQIVRQLGDRRGLQHLLGSQATILATRGDTRGAWELMKEWEGICRELGDRNALGNCLGNQATILAGWGALELAMPRLKEEQQIYRELGDLDGLQTSLGNQALLLERCLDPDGAMALHKEKERICRVLGNKASLQIALGNQALILAGFGNLAGAMELMKEQERICRDLEAPRGLAGSLINQALVLVLARRASEALPLAEEAHRVARRYGLTALLEELKPLVESVRRAQRSAERDGR